MAMTEIKNVQPFFDATPLMENPQALREKARQDGYLYLRELMDTEKLLNLRKQILTVCDNQGWIKPASPLLDGIVKDGLVSTEGRSNKWFEYYGVIQKIRDFHALALHPQLLKVFKIIFDGPVLPHSRNICRTIFPQSSDVTTPAHQDFIHIRGTEDTWTAWIPCGNCPTTLGGLSILPRSHQEGLLPVHDAVGAGGKGVDVPPESIWVNGDMVCGDVLVFSSLTVHQGRDNLSGNRFRISLDYRYQPLSEPIDFRSMLPHYQHLSWDEIYADWPEIDPVKNYWKKWKLNIAPEKQMSTY